MFDYIQSHFSGKVILLYILYNISILSTLLRATASNSFNEGNLLNQQFTLVKLFLHSMPKYDC